MTETRIKFSNIVKNQLPLYVREEFPLISEFLSQYYLSQEFKGASIDLIQNIDQYLKIQNQTNLIDSVVLSTDISFFDDEIFVTNIDLKTGVDSGTDGFSDSYGLLQIDDEIITYKSKTKNSFVGCIRGFVGITSIKNENQPDNLTFSSSESSEHISGTKVINLNNLFLKEFLKKIKYQLLPGLENRSLYSEINQELFIKQSKDFYNSKGTDESFKILFKSLYGENAVIIRPKEQIISPSNAQYLATRDFVVEALSGDPLKLVNQTLFQDEYFNIQKAYAPITKVEKIISDVGKIHYKLSIDGGYNRDIIVDGATYGNFSSHPKTKIIGQVSIGATFFDVDSTVGFPSNGELGVKYEDGTEGIISYSSKSLTQFFDCSNIDGVILDASDVSVNTYAYAIIQSGNTIETIKVRINSVLSDIELVEDTYYTRKDDLIQIKTLGVNADNFISNGWIFNLATTYDVSSIQIEDGLNNFYRINLKKEHIFRKGDSLLIIDSSSVQKRGIVLNIISEKSFIISGQGNLSLTSSYKVKRIISKPNSEKYSDINEKISTNVQNIYIEDDNVIVASSSIPTYYNQSLEPYNNEVIFSGTFSENTDEIQITSIRDHGFYTGDLVYYTPEKISYTYTNISGILTEGIKVNSGLFGDSGFIVTGELEDRTSVNNRIPPSEGLYYVKRLNFNTIKFAKSPSDIQNEKFIFTPNLTSITNNKIEIIKFKSKSIKSQKLLRKISPPITDGKIYSTPIGATGILVNGVEIINYKSPDVVYCGPIESIDVISPGSEYDIINPPTINISDSVGIGATAICSVIGNLKEIRIIDTGYDYLEIPSVKITGGNGINAKASSVMKLIDNKVPFNSKSSYYVGIGSTLSTIGFSTYHKFRNAEKVIYDSDHQSGIVGLVTSSVYYVSIQDNYTVKLHKTKNDAISGINTIVLSSYGDGTQYIQSYDKKSVLASINIDNAGIGYQNKQKVITSVGINTSLDTINIINHEYNSGEIVNYKTDDTPIGGLEHGKNYYIKKITDNSFALSQIDSVGGDFYYKTNQYINLTSTGSGNHIFNYPDINVEIIGKVGISSIGIENFKAKIQPIFRGTIQSVYVKNGGSNYGSSDILNYNKQPIITLNSGDGALITPIISNGSIVDLLINSGGIKYNSPPDLKVFGEGSGAILTPIIIDGQIKSIKIIEGGVGYKKSSTKIIITSPGKSAKFKANIKKWTVNIFERYLNNIKSDDGILANGINNDYDLQYFHLYAPRKLRDILYTKNQTSNFVYTQSDLDNDSRFSTLYHSPIIGWAYDGNPIYGPYGYEKKQGGNVTQMKSGYTLMLQSSRPNFPAGFFVEDYVYKKIDDESVLDENNGRFCITPEFPNGVYAYFATFNLQIESSNVNGSFVGIKKPVFPFLIGNTYKSVPNLFNFELASNQDEIDLNETNWKRNTHFYNLIDDNSSYSYLPIANSLNQKSVVGFSSAGSIDKIDILFGGYNYRINDNIKFYNSDSFGSGLSAKVSRVSGKQINTISVASTIVNDVEFYLGNNKNTVVAVSPYPHNLNDGDIVSISKLINTSSYVESFHNVGISTNVLSIASSISDITSTGIVTYFNVSGSLIDSKIRENDILSIGAEKVKVLNVDSISSRIRVLRQINATVGSSYSSSTLIYENSRKFNLFDTTLNLTKSYRTNKEIYFNPLDSIGIGTTGLGSTIVFSNPGVGVTQIFIPLKSIYLPEHGLETGDKILYSTNGGSPLQVSFTGIGFTVIYDQSTLYVAKISKDLIGISTVKVGLGSTGSFVGIASTQRNQTTLYFTGIGTGIYHSFKTSYDVVRGNVSKNLVTVSTASTHGLVNGDNVYVNVKSGITTTVIVKYDDYNRKILINPRDFTSVGVNTSNYTITIPNHNFTDGQKLVHTSISPAGGLQNEKIYYAVIVDKDTIKLSNTYYDSININSNVVGITSVSNGTLSPVNPPIKVFKNSSIVFDVSDSSLSYSTQSVRYSAFSLDFYRDKNLTDLFEASGNNNKFELIKIGTLGVSNNANITLYVNDYVPEKLYYKLTPVYNNILPKEKQEVSIDDSVISNNEIQIQQSGYNGKYSVSVASTNTFNYNLKNLPETNYYSPLTSQINYETDSLFAFGSISKIDITSKGLNFYILPGIDTVVSDYGYGAILDTSSKSIGKIIKTRINDNGFDFSSDLTVKPSASLPQIVKVDPFSSFDYIKITSYGRGYSSVPKLIVIDGKTNKVVSDVDISYKNGDNYVSINKNTYGINNIIPKIIPIQNSNGVGISSISFDSLTNNVTLILSSEFSTLQSFPFDVGDKILVENTNISGVNTNGRGYNSSNYNYNLFTIISISPNIGGAYPEITYNMNDVLQSLEFPGNFDQINSSGRVIPEKHFPTFNIGLKKNNFISGEKVVSNSASGYVLRWDEKTNYLTITSKETFIKNEVIKGIDSQSEGLSIFVNSFKSFFNVGPHLNSENGWNNNVGFLNDSLQRIQDSDYYQLFSYSIKSRVDYDTWKDVVSTLNHTAGFKKFADYQLETSLYYNNNTVQGEKNANKNSLKVGFTTSLCDIRNDITEVIDLNCVYDYDLVTENYLNYNSSYITDEVTFNSRILTNYFESIGNRVLVLDDISSQFNSFPRSTNFSEVYRFSLKNSRAQKYFIFVRDKKIISQRQFLITTLLHNNSFGFLNQYGRVETSYDMGSFDFSIQGTDGVLYFYPTKYDVNNYNISIATYNLNDNISGVGSTNIGGIVDLKTNYTMIPVGSTNSIVAISTSVRSTKVLVEISIDSNSEKYQFNELSLIHDGQNIQLLNYGQLTTDSVDQHSGPGFGTFNAYYSGSQMKIDFTPNVGIGNTAYVNAAQIAIANETSSGIGTASIKYLLTEARSISIPSNPSPIPTLISSYGDDYEGSYYVLQISDLTNNQHQISELIVIDDDTDVYFTEFAHVNTVDGYGTLGIGTISASRSPNTKLFFTPKPNIDVNIKVFISALRYQDDYLTNTSFNNGLIQTGYGEYFGTQNDVKKSFPLTSKNYPVFERSFDGSSPSVIDLEENTISIPNHFFVTGEQVVYSNPDTGSVSAIGIATTSFVGIGITDKLPSAVYIIKKSDNLIKLAGSASDALSFIPKNLNITKLGIGNNHTLTSLNQNTKAIISIDNLIQSPIVSTSVTTTLSKNIFTTDDTIYLSEINSFSGGDLIAIEDEIMKIDGIGIGSTNAIKVRRSWLGTSIAGYSTGSLVTKIKGNYNIVDNVLNFDEAPYGKVPQTTSLPNEVDWVGISTSSSFHGRVFLRSGISNSSNETYLTNYIFDDLSDQFDLVKNNFIVKSNQTNISGFSQDNAVILINNVFQSPGFSFNYYLSENAGITSITFTGTSRTITNDVGISSFPRGGIIVSVGSSEGFGYQPLISAGGTAVVSGLGTIQSISIGNSGSGYRVGIQTVRVGVATTSVKTPSIQFIGTATVYNGNIVSVAITNPGSGYTSSNPPYVIFDAPLSYSNIPLIYSSSSPSYGVGRSATVDIVVGQGSSIINFDLKNTGYSYRSNDILTIPTGGSTGIPTTKSPNFSEFKIKVERTVSDIFSGWHLGGFQVLDDISNLANGQRKSFPLKFNGNLISILSPKGSLINVQDTLLVFVNQIWQVPQRSYLFPGGSTITFTEPIKPNDKVLIVFYKGTGSTDVILHEIIEPIKAGDELTIGYDSFIGQNSFLQEDSRTITSINSAKVVSTNPYFGPGNVNDETLSRPIILCKQTEDKIINEQEIGKDRSLYEASIYPSSYLIQSVGIGSTTIYVDNIRPFFNPINENSVFQNKINIVPQESLISASATAIVSSAGTISSIIITNNGYGYSSNPSISIQSPIGYGLTLTATATVSLNSGSVSNITINTSGFGYTSTNPPVVLIEPPTLKIETDEVYSYNGDSGIIVGFGVSTVSDINKAIFDFYIPQDSYLRQSSLVGTAVTISSLNVGDYFVVYNSNIGIGTTTIVSSRINGTSIGVGTQYFDNVYQVDSAENIQLNLVGVGTTAIRRVYARISAISPVGIPTSGVTVVGIATTVTFDSTLYKFDSTLYTFDRTKGSTNYSGVTTISTYLGNFSWGKIQLSYRSVNNSYNFYGNNGVSGISTSAIVSRYKPLKSKDYI